MSCKYRYTILYLVYIIVLKAHVQVSIFFFDKIFNLYYFVTQVNIRILHCIIIVRTLMDRKFYHSP